MNAASTVLKWSFGLLLLLLTCELVVRLSAPPEYLVPRPSKVLVALFEDWQKYLNHTGTTALEAAAGLLIATVLASALGGCTALFPRVSASLATATAAAQSVPIIALAPLLTLWFGFGVSSKIAAAALIAVFPIIAAWMSGLQSPSDEEREFFRCMKASRWQTARYLMIPDALPTVMAGIRIAAPLAVIGAIVGEFVGAKQGLGFAIMTSTYYVRTTETFAAVTCASLVGITFWSVARLIELRGVNRWLGR